MNKGRRLSEEEVKEKLKDVKSGKIKIEPAERSGVLDLRQYVMQVLEAVGHPEAWVSDLSTIWDFSPADEKEHREFIARVSVKLGFTVTDKDYILKLAERLQDRDTNR